LLPIWSPVRRAPSSQLQHYFFRIKIISGRTGQIALKREERTTAAIAPEAAILIEGIQVVLKVVREMAAPCKFVIRENSRVIELWPYICRSCVALFYLQR